MASIDQSIEDGAILNGGLLPQVHPYAAGGAYIPTRERGNEVSQECENEAAWERGIEATPVRCMPRAPQFCSKVKPPALTCLSPSQRGRYALSAAGYPARGRS